MKDIDVGGMSDAVLLPRQTARYIVQLHLFTSVSDKLELYLYRQVLLHDCSNKAYAASVLPTGTVNSLSCQMLFMGYS